MYLQHVKKQPHRPCQCFLHYMSQQGAIQAQHMNRKHWTGNDCGPKLEPLQHGLFLLPVSTVGAFRQELEKILVKFESRSNLTAENSSKWLKNWPHNLSFLPANFCFWFLIFVVSKLSTPWQMDRYCVLNPCLPVHKWVISRMLKVVGNRYLFMPGLSGVAVIL